MACAEYQRWFSPYLDGLLTVEQRTELEAHLGQCTACRSSLASLQQMLQTLKTLEAPEAPNLLPGIHARLQPQPWWRQLAQRFTAPWPAGAPAHGLALATAAALIVIVVAVPRAFKRAEQTAQSKPLQLASSRDDMKEISSSIDRASEGDSVRRGSSDGPLEEADQRAGGGGETFRAYSATGATTGQDLASLDEISSKKRTAAPIGRMIVSNEVARLDLNAAASDAEGAPTTAAKPAAQGEEAVAPSVQVRGDGLLFQVEWRVADVQQASSDIRAWVEAHQGLAVATSEHHLSIKLQAAEVPALFQQFFDQDPSSTLTNPALWVTISLELLPSN